MKFVFVLFFLLSLSVEALTPSLVYWNNRGAQKMRKALLEAQKNQSKESDLKKSDLKQSFLDSQKLQKSREALNQALEKEPLNPVVHFNLGFLFFLKKDLEKALKEFLNLSSLFPKKSKGSFFAFFNAGVIQTFLSQKEKALEVYQKALGVEEESFETRLNIELLMESSQQQQGASQNQKKGGAQAQSSSSDSKDDKEGQDEDQKIPQGSSGEDLSQKQDIYKGQKLTEEQAQKVLEDIDRQEGEVRHKAYRQKKGQRGYEKDW